MCSGLPLQADDIRALLMDAMPPDALPSCFKPQATVVSASVISPASTPSCLSAASSIDNLAGPLTELAAAAASGSSGVADGASGTDRKEGESRFTSPVARTPASERRVHKVELFCYISIFPISKQTRYPVPSAVLASNTLNNHR